MQLFNEIEPFVAAWLRTLCPHAHVETRSIADLHAADVAGFRRVHFFAGIAGWEEALRLAGWPEEREIWTGSCPCQPFSVAGKRSGTADERHLWPEMFRLIRECHPATAMGEQVSSKDGLAWLDGLFADLEAEGYTCWAVDTCAAGVNSPHIRQRLYWAAESQSKRPARVVAERSTGFSERTRAGGDGPTHGLANANGTKPGRRKLRLHAKDRDGVRTSREQQFAETHRLEHAASDGRDARRAESSGRSIASECGVDGLGDTGSTGPQERQDGERGASGLQHQAAVGAGPWSNYRIEQLSDGTQRRIESSLFALAHGIPRGVGPIVAELGKLGFDPKTAKRIIANARRNRTGRLRGYGNAIVPQVAVEFIRSILESDSQS
jgi:DNA (cytosine-5)-methyltransferase 1